MLLETKLVLFLSLIHYNRAHIVLQYIFIVLKYIYLLAPMHALIKAEKSGCGWRGCARNSGWNCVPRKNGCLSFGSSAISINSPSGERPEKTRPAFSSSGINTGFTS